MMGLNPLHDWWKISTYTKWYHYFWAMPLIAIVIAVAWTVITVGGIVFGVVDWFKKIIKIFKRGLV
ncbi:hypothetical protein [Bacillus wiedmannii]|uniref:hypothetical protein n=1 Tax=Bacillus wiedmannii TaxID=1890302 RepID=UPI000BFB40B2|nr:hypothetical protein [Bacillus wiedmannii]PHE70584.1 hypothetical protein COF77_25565 [Bacillus wiedmannii]